MPAIANSVQLLWLVGAAKWLIYRLSKRRFGFGGEVLLRKATIGQFRSLNQKIDEIDEVEKMKFKRRSSKTV